MEIQIMSEDRVEEFSGQPIKDKCIIVSIRSRTCPKADIVSSSSIIDVLYLQFDDVTPTKRPDIAMVMTGEHAEEIKEFVDEYKDKVDLIIINCEAGISRSSAVAFGIGKYLGLDVGWIMSCGKYMPNWHCLNVLNNVLELNIDLDSMNKMREINYNSLF